MSRGRASRARTWLLAALLLGLTGLALLYFNLPEREWAPDSAPVPLEPFGVVPRDDLRFRWAMPRGGAAVRVEVLDGNAETIWTSPPAVSGSIRPSPRQRRALPSADLYWRPVAVPDDGEATPGDLAAFRLE